MLNLCTREITKIQLFLVTSTGNLYFSPVLLVVISLHYQGVYHSSNTKLISSFFYSQIRLLCRCFPQVSNNHRDAINFKCLRK